MMTDSGFLPTLVQLLINFAVYLFFVIAALHDTLNHRRWVQLFLIGGYEVVSIAIIMLFLLPNAPFPQYCFLVLLLWIGGTIAVCTMLFRSHLLQLVFIVFVVLDAQFNAMQVAEVLFEAGLFSRVVQTADLRLMLLNLLMLLAFIPLMWYLFIKLFRRVAEMQLDHSYWLYLPVIPMSAYLFSVFNSMTRLENASTSPVGELLILILLNVFSFLSYVAVLQMLIKTHEGLVATEKAAAANQQILIQNTQYRELADNMAQTRRLRHDLRHHFVTLKGYVEGGDLAGANKYLDDCIGRELPHEDAPICERHAVDMILRYYIALAREDGVRVQAAVQLPKTFGLPDTELCVVFGNLLENAVESCKRQMEGEKFITVKAKLVSSEMLALTVSNSFDGKIMQSGDELASRKHSGAGIGTQSVKSIAEKSGGHCQFSVGDGIFKASVLLIERSLL